MRWTVFPVTQMIGAFGTFWPFKYCDSNINYRYKKIIVTNVCQYSKRMSKFLWKPNALFHNSVNFTIFSMTHFWKAGFFLCLLYGFVSDNLFNRNILFQISLVPFGEKITVVLGIDRCCEWMIFIDKREGMLYSGNNKYLLGIYKMPSSVIC